MHVAISLRERSEIPSWVYDVKAEPSNVRSCTPKPKQQPIVQSVSSAFSSRNGVRGATETHDDANSLANRLVSGSGNNPSGDGGAKTQPSASAQSGNANRAPAAPATKTQNNPAKVLFKDDSPSAISTANRSSGGKSENGAATAASTDKTTIQTPSTGAVSESASVSAAAAPKPTSVVAAASAVGAGAVSEGPVAQTSRHKKNSNAKKNKQANQTTSGGAAGGGGPSKSVGFNNSNPNDFPPLDSSKPSGGSGKQGSAASSIDDNKRGHHDAHSENIKTSWSQDLHQKITSSPAKKAKKEVAADK